MEHSQPVRVQTKAKEKASWAFLGMYATLGTKLSSPGWESMYFMKTIALSRSAVSFSLSSHACLQSKSSWERDWNITRDLREISTSLPLTSPHKAVRRTHVSSQSLLLQTGQSQGPQWLLQGYVFFFLRPSYIHPECSGIKWWKIKLISKSLHPG